MDTSPVESLKRVLVFPFRQPGWQGPFVIGSVLILASFLIPLLPALFVAGYLLAVLRGVIDGEQPSLPEWQDWRRLLGDGFKAWLVGFVYLLPATLAFVIGWVVYFAAALGLMLATESGGPGATDASIMGLIAGMIVLFASTAVGMLLMILGWIPLPVALGNLAIRQTFGAGFHLRAIARRLAADPAGYFAAWVVVVGLSALVYAAGMLAYYTLVLICLMPLLTAPFSFYILLVGAALFGQAYREAAARLETPADGAG